jgi:hypothetical protein
MNELFTPMIRIESRAVVDTTLKPTPDEKFTCHGQLFETPPYSRQAPGEWSPSSLDFRDVILSS